MFGPLEFSRRDLMAINIQRGRDNGLADYNSIREAYDLPRITEWTKINPELYREKPNHHVSLKHLRSKMASSATHLTRNRQKDLQYRDDDPCE